MHKTITYDTTTHYPPPPKEPTDKMIVAGKKPVYVGDSTYRAIYKAMLSAAPELPDPAPVDVEVLKKPSDKQDSIYRDCHKQGWNACIDHLAANGYLSSPEKPSQTVTMDDMHPSAKRAYERRKERLMQEKCELNGYTPLENEIQKAICDIVPNGTAKPVSTRVADIFRKHMSETKQPQVTDQETAAALDALEAISRKPMQMVASKWRGHLDTIRAALFRPSEAKRDDSKLLEAAREFVRRVEIGEVRSKKSYAAFKEALAEYEAGQ
ncbi:hypothetical protein [Hymenobacter fodinae]|uniref:Uncharacterized protein n=1 Tax=Hymenobacter fodinae TaxID=2510796 RepID=A0A4Z0P107_9BACT|nr:hypothetical protein EU556_20720 [Hymenobacter fodinae]